MNNTSKGLIITSSGVLLMSLESLFIKLTTISPYVFSFYLGIFIFLAMALTIIVKEKNTVKEIRKTSLSILLLCGLLMGIANIFFISAVKSTTVANVVIIFGTSALFTSILAYLIYREKIKKNIMYASFFVFIGLYIIFSDELGLGNLKGNIYAVLCVFSFSIVYVLLSKHTKISRVVLTALTGLSLSLLAFFLTEDINIDLHNLGIIAVMGLFITPYSRVLIGNGTKFIHSSEVSLLLIIETLMAPIWVWIFLHEVPSNNTFFGGSIILLTLVINSLYSLNKGKIR